MLYVIIGRAREDSDIADRTARRLEWEYPEGVNVVSEYWLQRENPRIISIVEADDDSVVDAFTADWVDHFEFTVDHAITAEQGLDLIRERYACKGRLEALLRGQKVSYETQHHPVAYTAQEVAASEHVSGELVVKVVMVLADGELVMTAVPAPYHLNLDRLRTVLSAQEVRLATEDEFAGTFPDCEIGAMPPFGYLYGVPLYADASLTEDESIYFNAGTHTDTMSMRYDDYARIVQPSVADFAEHD